MTIASFGVDTPLGTMRAAIGGERLLALDFAVDGISTATENDGANRLLAMLQRQMDEWWAGARARFELPLGPCGTPFQRAVWAAAADVPRGSVQTYGELARRLGREGAHRAVGAALGRNPWLLVVPCHRVVAADGSLAGYAGGLARKHALLAAEAGVLFAVAGKRRRR